MAKEEYLRLCVKQGEELNRGFTIKVGGNPIDLSPYTIIVQVKRTPLEKSKPIVDKTITTVSDLNVDGQILNPQQGEFVLHLTKEDTSWPTGEYALIIALQQENSYDIISSACCNKAVYAICEQ